MRWRDVKQNRVVQKVDKTQTTFNKAPFFARIKAFIIDIFMIYIPILYITTYLVLDGKDDFLASQISIFIDVALFGLILAIFWTKSGQSPGYRAYELEVIDKATFKSPTFLRSLWRYFCFLLSGATFFGLFVFWFRKDRAHFHELLSNTISVVKQ